nr:hypothetical protein CFP56_13553 [Quercus suber]
MYCENNHIGVRRGCACNPTLLIRHFDVEVQLNLKEPFGFGPWLKAKSSSKRTSRWVEFIADSTQSNDEEDEGRKEAVA